MSTESRIVLPVKFEKSTLIAAVLLIIAVSPLIDHMVPATAVDSINISSLLTLFLPVVGIFLAFQLRTTSLLVTSSMLTVLGISLSGSVHALTSESPVSVLGESAKVFAGLALLWLLPLAWRTELKTRTLLLFYWLLVFSAATHAGVALLQLFGQVDFTYFQRAGGVTSGRPSGSYFHPVSLAFFFVFVALFTNLLADRHLISRFWRLTLTVASVGGVLLTTHRASLAVLIGALALYACLIIVRRSRVRISYIVLSLALVLVAGIFFNLMPASRTTSLFSGVTGFISSATFNPADEESFLRGRGVRWSRTTTFMQEAPLHVQFFGVGYQPIDPHSDYLRFLLVNGWVGLISVAASITLMTVWLWQRLNDLGRIHLAVLMAVTAIFSVTVKPSTYTFYMWLVAAFCIILLQLYPRLMNLRSQLPGAGITDPDSPSSKSPLT